MDVPISLGQGVGLAAACGLIALVPLLIGAIAAAAGALPGAVDAYDDTLVIIGSAIAAIANVAASGLITGTVRLALATVGGALACELTAGDSIPIVPILIGGAVGFVAAYAGAAIIDGAQASGGTPGALMALVTSTAVVVSGLAIVPFLGYLIAAAAIWLALRVRRRGEQKFAGLRVLR
jgi:hypothetical protein